MTHFCFCTLAINESYRRRARSLCADTKGWPWIVLTDAPEDFDEFDLRALRHTPTGPMAPDYVAKLPATGDGRGAAAYHDKRFALMAALEDFDSAIYVDADSRVASVPRLRLPRGISVLPLVRESVRDHLADCGPWRMSVFEDLAIRLTGDTRILKKARWCHETLIAITKDGNESKFFAAWATGADFLQSRGVFSGEGGVIGLAAAKVGWKVNYRALRRLGAAIRHEGGGPKLI
jgi:hypothetical protein